MENDSSSGGGGSGARHLEARKQRWRRAMNGEPSPRHLLMIRYQPDDAQLPWAWPHPDLMSRRTEIQWKRYELAMRRAEWLDDDSLPYLNCLTGTEIFAEAFGCQVHRPSSDMPFALPMVHSAAEASKLKVPALDAPPLKRMFDMADELVRRAGGKGAALVRPVDVQSPMDIAALIWDKNDLFLAMIETPEAVKELAYKARQLLTAFLDEWFSRYGREFVAHWPEYYMPQGMSLSEDEIGIVSNDMFEEFFLPELVYLSEHFGGLGMHSCADSQHHWASFRRIPNLRFLNLKHELRQQAYPYFAGGGKQPILQQHGDGTEDEWDQILRDCPQARLYIDLSGKNRDDALRLMDKYGPLLGR